MAYWWTSCWGELVLCGEIVRACVSSRWAHANTCIRNRETYMNTEADVLVDKMVDDIIHAWIHIYNTIHTYILYMETESGRSTPEELHTTNHTNHIQKRSLSEFWKELATKWHLVWMECKLSNWLKNADTFPTWYVCVRVRARVYACMYILHSH